MNDNRIRKITVANGITGKNEDGTDFSKNMIYEVGRKFTVVVDSKKEDQFVSSIEEVESEKRILIYLSKNEEVQLWRDLPKNSDTTIEYYIN